MVAKEKNIAVETKLGKLTSSVSQEKMSGENKFSKVHGFSAGRPNMSPMQSSFRLVAIENEMRIAMKDEMRIAWVTRMPRYRSTG